MCAYQGLRPWLRSLALRAKTEVVHCLPGTASLATFVRPRAGTHVVQCPPARDFVPGYARPPSGREQESFNVRPGTSSLAAFARPPGEDRSWFLLSTRDCVLATLARPPGGNRSCSLSTRDFVPGYVRSPSGRRQSWFLLFTRDCVPGNARPPSGRKEEMFNVRLPGTSSLATIARPPGEDRVGFYCLPGTVS
mgnify:FL=1